MSDLFDFQYAGFAMCFSEWATRWRYNQWICFHLKRDFLFWISWTSHVILMMNPLMEKPWSEHTHTHTHTLVFMNTSQHDQVLHVLVCRRYFCSYKEELKG